MRIFQAFLIIIASTLLFLVPITESVEEFLVDTQEDNISVSTAVGETSENVTLSETLYDSDISSVVVISDLSSDTVSWSSYNATPNHFLVSGMTANTSRLLTVSYDIDALGGNAALILLANRLPIFWLVWMGAFAPAALAAIFTGRA